MAGLEAVRRAVNPVSLSTGNKRLAYISVVLAYPTRRLWLLETALAQWMRLRPDA